MAAKIQQYGTNPWKALSTNNMIEKAREFRRVAYAGHNQWTQLYQTAERVAKEKFAELEVSNSEQYLEAKTFVSGIEGDFRNLIQDVEEQAEQLYRLAAEVNYCVHFSNLYGDVSLSISGITKDLEHRKEYLKCANKMFPTQSTAVDEEWAYPEIPF